MPICAIQLRDTNYVVNPHHIRWFELNRNRNELTLYYMDGMMEVLRHERILDVYYDLQLQFTIIKPDED